jgi:hypothetical protein
VRIGAVLSVQLHPCVKSRCILVVVLEDTSYI